MSDPRFETMHAVLNEMAPLPDSEWTQFRSLLQLLKLSTGDVFLNCNNSAERVGFILKGLLKVSYLTRGGQEFIRTFCFEKMFAADLAALYQSKGVPSTVNISVLEPTEMVIFDYENFRARFQTHWTWQQIGRLFAERYYLIRERRQFELQTMSASERLESFLRQFPGLANRVSHKDLARYLSITPESLSRLRARLKERD